MKNFTFLSAIKKMNINSPLLSHRLNTFFMKKIITCLVLLYSLFGVQKISAQAVGDYGTAAAGPASWVTAANWVVCVTPL